MVNTGAHDSDSAPSFRPPGTESVPWQGTLCVPCQVELRSRHIESGSAGLPREFGARHRGGLPLVTFLGRARKVTSRRAAPGLSIRRQKTED